MSADDVRLDRVRRQADWYEDCEPKNAWIRGGAPGARLLVPALMGIGATCIHLEPTVRYGWGADVSGDRTDLGIARGLEYWLSDLHLEVYDERLEVATLAFALEANQIDLFIDFECKFGHRVAQDMGIPSYTAWVQGSEFGFSPTQGGTDEPQ